MRKDLTPREVVVVAPLIALILLLGFYPKPVHRRHQPRRQGHPARHRHDRPGTDRARNRRRQVNLAMPALADPRTFVLPHLDYTALRRC